MQHETPDFLKLFENAPVPVIPVLVIEHAHDAVPIAQALVAGGLRILEITLRTRDALDAVSLIRNSIPEALVGVGSVIDVGQFGAAVEAGAQFAVSPGMTAKLAAGAASSRLPWLPGAQTVSEVLALREQGYRMVKLFPSHSAGGINFLRAILGPVPDMKFCPTGGVSATATRDYLALPNVVCVGGSWLTTPSLIAERRWEDIQTLAREASSLAASL